MYPFSNCVVISLLATQGELKGLCNIALAKSVTKKNQSLTKSAIERQLN